MQISVNFTDPRPGLPNGAQFTVHLYNLEPMDIQQRALDFIKEIHVADKLAGNPVMFNVWLSSFGDRKINTIKLIRSFYGLTLKDAKDITDRLDQYPGKATLVATSDSKANAEAFCTAIGFAGGEAHFDAGDLVIPRKPVSQAAGELGWPGAEDVKYHEGENAILDEMQDTGRYSSSRFDYDENGDDDELQVLD